MKIHELKTDPGVFAESWRGDKPFEIRFDDRGFATGDILVLKETEFTGEQMAKGAAIIYTGRQITRRIICKTTNYGLLPGWCILGVQQV